jgi:ArsR family transcriptional regulator
MEIARAVQSLKGLADPTRLRLLALLSHGELTVGEISRVLGHSQPRVSRHLRLLSEAGFLDRFREKQCVYYRAPATGVGAVWLRELLAAIDPGDPELQRDRARLGLVVGDRARAAARTRKRTVVVSA